jgi:hypothetical protein
LGYLTTSEEEVEITPPASPVKKFVEWFHFFLCLEPFSSIWPWVPFLHCPDPQNIESIVISWKFFNFSLKADVSNEQK